MKKCSVITGMILASLLLFMNSCEKDYLNAEEISYSLTVSDTVYLNEPVTIKGVINQDLDIRVYWENYNRVPVRFEHADQTVPGLYCLDTGKHKRRASQSVDTNRL